MNDLGIVLASELEFVKNEWHYPLPFEIKGNGSEIRLNGRWLKVTFNISSGLAQNDGNTPIRIRSIVTESRKYY